jgi:hypothetical protein
LLKIKFAGTNRRAAWILCAKYAEFKHWLKIPLLPFWIMIRFEPHLKSHGDGKPGGGQSANSPLGTDEKSNPPSRFLRTLEQ